MKSIALLLIGGSHHILHLVPVAAELWKMDKVQVTIFVMNSAEKTTCEGVLAGLGMMSPNIQILSVNRRLRKISPKLMVLLSNRKLWKSFDALIVAERTSTILRYLPGKFPAFIHIPHGAGDRAKSYDPRIRHFDHVLVAGIKDKTRMIERGIVTEDNCHVTGYIKPFAVNSLNQDLPDLFENKNKIVLYNPHFSTEFSSWGDYGVEILDSFVKEEDTNFIFAPHIRLFKSAAKEDRLKIESYNQYPNIHVDLGSVSSTDMTYTRLADIYLGDVSSQVYEFLYQEPKPCVFIGAEDVDWQYNPDYAHWSYGQVCHSVPDVMTALRNAHQLHDSFRDVQTAGCTAAMAPQGGNPIKRAAEIVVSLTS